MAEVSPPDSTKIIDNDEFTVFSTDCEVSTTGDETTAEWESFSLTPSCPRLSVELSGSTATVTYDGLGLFNLFYLRYEIDGYEESLTTIDGDPYATHLALPDEAKEIIAVQKDPSSIKTFTLVLNWKSDLSSGSVTYQIDIKANYTTVKDWLQTEVDKRR